MTPEEANAYYQGYLDGLAAYAINKDGTQIVGSLGKTLRSAQRDAYSTWNYNPRIHHAE